MIYRTFGAKIIKKDETQAKKYDFSYFQLEHRIKVEIIKSLTFSIKFFHIRNNLSMLEGISPTRHFSNVK